MRNFMHSRSFFWSLLIVMCVCVTFFLASWFHCQHQSKYREIHRTYVPVEPTENAPSISFDGTFRIEGDEDGDSFSFIGTCTFNGHSFVAEKTNALSGVVRKWTVAREPVYSVQLHETHPYFDALFSATSNVVGCVLTFNSSLEFLTLQFDTKDVGDSGNRLYIWHEMAEIFLPSTTKETR